ncbi:hypothetical protein ACN27G_01040 [Plantactinospora sp. WMMB334]|uniref:hypothetical protein n=1 Tax=Plantactinospora sp. WMMB334 TaxID=3404119 RepID=UPI003B957909
MADPEIPDIVCDVDLHQEDGQTYIPSAWIEDEEITFAEKGFLVFLANFPLGRVIRPVDQRQPHPDDPPLVEMVESLKTAGYLVPDTTVDKVRYCLVHPDRLGSMPVFGPEGAL